LLPLVLAEPSVASVDIRPSSSGLLLTLLAEGGDGPPALPPVPLPPPSSRGVVVPIELAVPGSGVFMMQVGALDEPVMRR
jgi:hypothetical protein